MNDQDLRRLLTAATETVDRPTDEFVDRLGRRLDIELWSVPTLDGTTPPPIDDDITSHQGGIMVLELDDRPPGDVADQPRFNRRLLGAVAAAAVVVVVGLTALFWAGRDGTNVSTADDPITSTIPREESTVDDVQPAPEALPTEPIAVGEAWIQSILDGDRDTFVALHAPNFTAHNTLMMASSGMPVDQVESYYFDGFDARTAWLRIGGDPTESDGCEEKPNGRFDCGYTQQLLGRADKLAFIRADLAIVDGLVTDVRLDVSHDPDGLMSLVPLFLGIEATETDRECADIGFNSVECADNYPDMLRRYLEYRDEQLG